MILNISGRTDIVAFYTPWLMKRFEEGFVDVRNPFYPKKVSRIYFSDVELIVFCTKNPLPILPYLEKIDKPILFHVTLTPYQKDIEPFVIDKTKIIKGIRELSKVLGKEYVYVRYDPILVNNRYTISYHIKAFEKLCNLLDGYIHHIIISFVDMYKNVEKNANLLQLKELQEKDYEKLGLALSEIGKKHHMVIQTCYEGEHLTKYGLVNEPCVSKELAFQLTGKKYPKWNARPCNCANMVDIGAYNSCSHLCKYCYANYDEKKVKANILKHDVHSTMLLGCLEEDDEIIVRKK